LDASSSVGYIGGIYCNLYDLSVSVPDPWNTPVYTWSNGQSTSSINNLSSGIYSVTATNSYGCSLTQNTSLTQPSSLNTSITTTDVTCYGATNGTAQVTTIGGVGSYITNWSNNVNPLALLAGNYTVTVTDGNGCVTTENITINQPSPITISSNIQPISCAGNDGSISLTITGGDGNYTTTWQNGIVPNNLTVGIYSVTVTDGNGCSKIENISVQQLPPLVINSTINNVICNGYSNGNATLSITGGDGNYSTNWSNSANPSALSVGNYTVTVTDANGCYTIEHILITEPPALIINPIITDVICHGDSNGTISLNPSGGTGNYNINWDENVNPSSLYADIYITSITDANGCQLIDTFIINELPVLTLSLSAVDESCFNTNDGSVSAVFSGGTDNLTLNWNGIDTTALDAGNYLVTLIDSNSCMLTDSFIINQPPSIISAIITNQPTCFGGNDGSASITATGGTGILTYNWGGINTNALLAGNYAVSITDDIGCQLIDTIAIENPEPIEVSYSLTDASCFESYDGTASFNFMGGTAPYNITLEAGVNPNALVQGDYLITVTDINNCTIIDTFTIGSPNDVTVSIILINATGSNSQDGTINLIVSGDYPPFTYDWSNGATSNNISNLNPDDYTVDITDANGCTFQRIYSVGNLTSTDFKKAIEYIKLFPNPTSSHINLEVLFKMYSEVNITITDMNGRILEERNIEGTYITQHFNLDSFSDGLYILRISTESGITYKKFIITK
jgi:hypothetical protein